MKNKKTKAELTLKTDPLAKMAPDHNGGEYDIHMALSEAKEKYGHLLREVHPRTIYHQALMLLKSKRAATQSPRIFEGENEYQAWLKSKGISELDDDYISETGRRPKFPSTE
jgi:hypothetical protein